MERPSQFCSVTTDVCPGVQMSALDVVSVLSADNSVTTPLLDNVWLQPEWRLLHVVGNLSCQ